MAEEAEEADRAREEAVQEAVANAVDETAATAVEEPKGKPNHWQMEVALMKDVGGMPADFGGVDDLKGGGRELNRVSSLDELFDDDAPELSHQQPSKKHHLERGGAPAAPFKIIIVGDSGVGKTCLLVRFVQGRYEGNEKPTVSVDVMSTEIDLGDSTVGLSLWDTAGQERFAPLSAPFFRQADGIVLVFDVGARKSFERLDSHWVDELATKAEPEANVLLIGSKADLPPESRAITDEEARAFAEAHGWDYFETSAKSGAHVRDAFYLLACNVMNRLLESDPRNLINDQKVALQAKGAKTRCC